MALRWGTADAERVITDHGVWLALAEGEAIEFAAKTVRDMVIFTDRRLVVTDTQGVLHKKTEYLSVPYRAVGRWSVESRGRGMGNRFDGADLKIWLGAAVEPLLNIELQKDESAQEVMALLSKHAM